MKTASPMTKFEIKLTGTDSLLMHDATRMSNPLDLGAREMKKLSSKRQKTIEDYQALADVEFRLGMYYDAVAGPYVPGDNLWRCLQDGARKMKLGTAVKAGLIVGDLINPLGYSGTRDLDKLTADANFRHYASVKVGMARVSRCRPIFRDWSVIASGTIDPAVLDIDQLQSIADLSGQLVGLGDWRPRFGRFTAAVREI